LTLRPVAPEDQAPVLAGLNDPAVSGWLAVVPFPYVAADFTAFQAGIARPGQTWTILEAGKFAGIIGLEGGHLGYWLTPAAQGRRIATEAARAVLADRFSCDASPVLSVYFAGYARSWNVLRKLGFTETGRDRKFNRARGHDLDHVGLVLTEPAFRAALPWDAHSARLSYRSLRSIDAAALHEIIRHHAITRNLGPKWPWPSDPAFTLTRAQPHLGPGFHWGMFRDGALVGTIGVTAGELGYALHPDHHRQGLATEACQTVLARAFDTLGLIAVKAEIWADNLASLGLLQKLGFQITGQNSGTSACRPDPAPGFDLLLTKDTWKDHHDA
jgi:RimJ/RimL family protein N-acetyltransferase